jgi:AAA+ superfamily predicted ATPase
MKNMDLVDDAAEVIGNGGKHYGHAMRHIERIDLLLQQYYYRQGRNHVLDDFLLSEDEVETHLTQPQGAPNWVMREGASSGFSKSWPFASEEDDNFCQLIERFDLTEFEGNVLLLGILPYFDSRYHALFSALLGDKQKKLPTFELALTLFCDSSIERSAHRASFLPQSPLLSNRLLGVRDGGASNGESWSQRAFITTGEVFHYLLGNDYLSPELRACAEVMTVQGTIEAEGNFAPFLASLRDMLVSPQDDIRPVIMLRGREGSGRAMAVAQVAEAAGRATVTVDVTRLPESDAEAQEVLAQAFRYARMRAACVLLRNFSELAEARKALLPDLSRQFEQPGLAVVCLVEPYSPLVWLQNIPQLLLEMPVRSAAEKARLLSESLAPLGVSDIDAVELSRSFHFTPETLPSVIQEAVFYGQLRDPHDGINQHDLRKALRMRSQQNFGKLAQRMEPKRHLDDLIVSDELRQQLKEIMIAFEYRERILKKGFAEKVGYGTGISALFYGPSGTGKTMAAEVLAAHQGVDLVKVDLSTVVNKYIGETEKNLSRIFDLAEADAGVLFFDEADALFGKRSETKDAQDRHANIEVSYLLQRLESYPGLVILATNNRSHLDDAFSRRFTFITRFYFPDVALREQMWRAIWPSDIQLDQHLDFNSLARLADITGANIRNIALLSSWLAADDSSGIVKTTHIEIALKRELAKIGRLIV